MKNLKAQLSIILFLLIIPFSSCQAQEKPSGESINWMSFEEAVQAGEKNPKKIFIDVYTNWCGWCKRMDATTFKDSSVVRYMNSNYYAVKLNAETRDTIRFRDKVFTYKAEYKSNELAASLLNGQMSYPSFVFLDENFNMLSPLPGYQTVPQLQEVMQYFGENIYRSRSWEDYHQSAGAVQK